METTIEKKHDAAMSTILADLFRRQIAALQNKVNLEKLEASLSKRAQDIQQTEAYLAEGQRILTDKLRGQKVDTKSLEALQITNAYNQGRVASEIQYQHIERSWQAKTDSFELRKQNLKMREEACMATARDRLAKELREDIEYELESEVSDVAYRRGFEAGKEEGMRIQGGWKLPPVPPPVHKGLFDDIIPAPAMHNGRVILAGYGGKKESQEKGGEKEEKKGQGKASAIPNLIDI
ncbi:hypothetical protein BS50DRAFT_211028 [Corynespora cassiicola Philippines]|uniref:Uncharacterized protein n=1 Tax=Corynespora cassiicola Philippines TaxID=1448308 RepID=A0A2T2N585_CORCC|nr:hypothetical protein BS50DRAFT_211028 [Corynespora cassiicola Philippines]